MGNIFAFMTATSVDHHGPDDYTESHGWIDPQWSMTELFESRNDATPLINVDEHDEDLADEVRDVLGDLSAYEDNGEGTFYGQDETVVNGVSWTYDIHFKRKHNGANGWTEDDWHPVTDGGIDLTDAS